MTSTPSLRFSIAGKIYDAASIEDLSLHQLLMLQAETKDTAQPLDVATVQEMASTLDKLKSDEERKRHPFAPWVLAVTIWASRRLAGEEITFAAAIDFPMRQLEFLPTPQDRKKPDPTRRSRQGSAGAARSRAAVKSTARTSKRASTAG